MWETGPDASRPQWQTVETEFSVDLFGVVQTVEGPYAVGSSGTLVGDRGDGWEVIFDDGPATRNNQLRAMDVTSDGRRLWMLGSSGVIACYDVEERRKFDYSYPEEMTSTWEAITCTGQKGQEKVLAANGSGEILPFTIDGFDVQWGQLRKPVSGRASNVAALGSSPDGVGFAVDTSGNAFKTTPREGWKDIGVVNAQVKFYDIYAGRNHRVYIAAGDGRIYRYDDSYHSWTPIGVASGVALRAIDVEITEDGAGEMVTLGGNGNIYQRTGTERWLKLPSPTSASLFDLTIGGDTDVAVGQGGTVIERPRKADSTGSSPDGDQYEGRGETYDSDQTSGSTDTSGSSSGDSTSGGDGTRTTTETQLDAETQAGVETDGQSVLSDEDVITLLVEGLKDDGIRGDYSAEIVEDSLVDLAIEADAGSDRVLDAILGERLSNEETLVLLGESLDLDNLPSAAGYNIEQIEDALMELAASVDADTERVRRAIRT